MGGKPDVDRVNLDRHTDNDVVNAPATTSDWLAHWQGLGALPKHVDHLMRTWLKALPLSRGRRQVENFLPLAVRQDWPAVEEHLKGLATIASQHPAEDGAQRLLVRLADGQTVESVLLPRGGLCVSSQAGCAVGCVFCMTGREGLMRQLSSSEILAQVALARRLRAVNKVVFMGMGEPSHNLDAVLDAIQALGTWGEIGHKNLVFSTVGDERAFERLPSGRVKPALALSLHTTRTDLREQLLPRAPRISPEDLLAHADAYACATGYPAQIQWTLLAGVNDTDEECERLIAWMRGKKAMLNLILYNHIDDLPYERPDIERAAEMARHLNRHGVLTRLRQSAGQDVDGGCGQLRARENRRVRERAGVRPDTSVVPIVPIAPSLVDATAPGTLRPAPLVPTPG